jgi:pimeloyl-ACP methyl ester carboxylesterase
MESRTWGDANRPPIILLHALGCHSGWWEWVAPYLAERFRVVAPDFRGHGDSSWTEDYSYDAYAADVEALAATLGADPPLLVGHSMGAYVALTVAARGVVKPEGVVVADMKTSASTEELAGLAAASQRPGRTFATLDAAVSRYQLAPPEHCVPAERLAAVARQCYRELPDGTWAEKFDRRALAIGPLAPLDLAARIRCPMLVMRGERSSLMLSEPARYLARAAGAPLVELPGLFHHLPLENPAGFAEAILKYFPG